ncbi:hypothetical protein BJ508DRAFT_302595 [Ascobolus immersus RN42]|uniref:Uncharacterized protein n=1 Tax=Ascobolus immersus RN42 TaxID=1160509 RepID=A0A3N4IK00_ASCIM|nr:hypothetical protein BJ508DRAFT_302595 [Ascobolus immersus RN42]
MPKAKYEYGLAIFAAFWYEPDLYEVDAKFAVDPHTISCTGLIIKILKELKVESGRFSKVQESDWDLYFFTPKDEADVEIGLKGVQFRRQTDGRLCWIERDDAPGSLDRYMSAGMDHSRLFWIVFPRILEPDGSISRETLIDMVQISPNYEPRLEMMETLWERLEERRVIHARGVPGSGKSTLATQFHNYMTWKKPELMSLVVSWNEDMIASNFPNFQKALHANDPYGYLCGMPSAQCMLMGRYLLIIDEAQNTYTNLGVSFWREYIKMLLPMAGKRGDRPCVLLLSSYGSPGDVALPLVGLSTSTTLRPCDYMSIRPSSSFTVGLYFTRHELGNFTQRYFRNIGRYVEGEIVNNYVEVLSEEALDYIYHLTSGHPGLCHGIFEVILGNEKA